MAGNLLLSKQEVEDFAKLLAKQPELKETFDCAYIEARLARVEIDLSKVKRLKDCPRLNEI